MPDVQFQEDNYQRFNAAPQQASGLVGMVIKSGLAKNQKDAEIVLIGILIVVLIITFFFLYRWSASTSINMPPPLPVSIPQR